MNRKYELVYVVSPDATDDQVSDLHKQVDAIVQRMGGELELENADIRWFLSTSRDDLPADVREKGAPTYRLITIDGEQLLILRESDVLAIIG